MPYYDDLVNEYLGKSDDKNNSSKGEEIALWLT